MRTRMPPSWCFLAFPGALSGCFDAFGTYEEATGFEKATSAGSTGGGPLACGDGLEGACVSVPLGWEGPAALSDPGGRCGGAYPTSRAEGEARLSAAEPVCGCACAAPAGITCAPASLEGFTAGDCAPSSTLGVLSVGTDCVTRITGMTNAIAMQAGATPAGGSCDAMADVEIAPVSFDPVHVCAGAEVVGECEDGSCLPLPADGLERRICVFAAGDLECPGGTFSNKTVVARGGHADDRRCDGACSCLPPTGGVCHASVTVYASANCGTGQLATASTPPGACTAIGAAGFSSAKATLVLEPGACEPSAPIPAGEVVALDPVTVCCTNPL